MRDGVEHNHRKWGGEAHLGYGHIRGVPARAGPERGAHDKHKRWQRFKHQHQSMDEAYHSMIRAGQLRDGERRIVDRHSPGSAATKMVPLVPRKALESFRKGAESTNRARSSGESK